MSNNNTNASSTTRRQRRRKGNANVPNRQASQLANATNAPLAFTIANSNRTGRKRKRSNNRSQRKRQPARIAERMDQMSQCAAKYLSALLDPEFTPCGACVPFGFPQPSQKAKGYTSGRLALGTSGIGFLCCGIPVVNDSTSQTITYTIATSVGTAGDTLTTFTNRQTTNMPNLPYDLLKLGSTIGVAARAVCQIMKVRYAGKEADRNGTVYAYEQPEHLSLMTSTPTSIISMPQRTNERPRMDGSWHTLLYSGPIQAGETDFIGGPSANENYLGQRNMVLLIQGTAGDVYDFEIFNQVEYIGAVNQTSPAEADSQGYTNVMSAIKNAVVGTSLTADSAYSIFNSLLGGGGLAQLGKQFIKTSISSYLTSANQPARLML